jgi:hypothetical protein
VSLAAELAGEVVQVDSPELGAEQALVHDRLDLDALHVVVAGPRLVVLVLGIGHLLLLVPVLLLVLAAQHETRLVVGQEARLVFEACVGHGRRWRANKRRQWRQPVGKEVQ